MRRGLDGRGPSAFVLVGSSLGADLALRQTVNVMAQGGAPKLSHVRLHFRMRRAYPFLAALVAQMTADVRGDAAPELWAGYEMMCLDGSTVCGPAAEGIDARLHLVLRLGDLRVTHAKVTDVSEGETLRRFCWSAGQLVIIDRGYSNAPGIVWAVDQGADVSVRLNRGALPVFDDRGEAMDILSWCRALSGHRATEQNVDITHREGRQTRRIQGRLIGFRLPEEEAAQARRRAREETGPGSGIHVHLNGGLGLADLATPGAYETGWAPGPGDPADPTATSMCPKKGPASARRRLSVPLS